jgi:hypothetical protein
MNSVELFAQKIQSILGSQYKLLPYHQFINSFAKPIETPYGEAYTIDYQALKEDNDKIIAIAKLTPQSIPDLPYIAESYNFEITFSVPFGLNKVDENGTLLETPPFNFFADYDRLKAAVKDTKILFYDEYNATTNTYAKTYKGRVALSPIPEYFAKEKNRILWLARGNFQISNTTVGTGDDVKVCFAFKNGGAYVEYFFDNITGLNIGADTKASENQKEGNLGGEQDVSAINHGVSFAVDDVVGSTDLAMQCVRDKAFKNLITLSGNETDDDLQKKVRTRIYKDIGGTNTLMLDFWASLSVEYRAASEAAYAAYVVTLVNDQKGV